MPRLVPGNRVLPQTLPIPGYNHFLTPLRKLILDYDPLSPSQHGIRYDYSTLEAINADHKSYLSSSYIQKPLIDMARANPDVEILVRKMRRNKPALLRGHYGESVSIGCELPDFEVVNGRDKVICVNKLEPSEVSVKVRRSLRLRFQTNET